jgi:pyridoxal phosphate enzyme (YggS family)
MCSAHSRLQEVQTQIAAAATLALREPTDIRLIAVTKGRSMPEVDPLIEAGQRTFGESRIQEAKEKWPSYLARCPDIELHLVGRLQSNKAADAVRLFDVIHSVDRLSLLEALSSEANKAGRAPRIYIQVNIGDEPQKGGCAIEEVGELVSAVRKSSLPLAGLMAIPPQGLEPAPFFALLAELARRHDVIGLSMGMSGDFAAAVMLGATAVRIGSALFEDA